MHYGMVKPLFKFRLITAIFYVSYFLFDFFAVLDGLILITFSGKAIAVPVTESSPELTKTIRKHLNIR